MLQNAKWISLGENLNGVCHDFRKSFTTEQSTENIARAKIYASAMGLYKILVNGKEVTDTLFNPCWTTYFKRVQYQCFDVTSLKDGENTLSITGANGWAVDFRETGFFSKNICVIARLEITYKDGSVKEGVVTITRDVEAPEGVNPFLDYAQETENMRTVTIISNPGTENEKTDSIQVPKGLQVSVSPDFSVEEAMNLYADAACTQMFDDAWDVNTDLTIYVKWGE
jgi:hypothetical protein